MRSVKIICIPQDGSPSKIVTVPLIGDCDLKPTGKKNSDILEERFAFVPGLADYSEWYQHGELNRELVDLGNMDPDEPFRDRVQDPGPYFLYKLSKNSQKPFPSKRNQHLDLKPNQHFKDVDGGQDVYGNAFIFKLWEPVVADVESVDDLNEAVIKSAFKGKGICDAASLKWLSNQGRETRLAQCVDIDTTVRARI